MTALCHFPTPPAYAAQLRAEACRQEVVESAHAIIRGAARHGDATLIEACRTLQTWGDATDWLEADAMLLALSLRAHRQRQDARKPRPVIRSDEVALILGAAFAVGMFAYVVSL